MSEIPPALTAYVDQAHAAAEHIVDKLVDWWSHARNVYPLNSRTDEVAVLTHLLAGNVDTVGLLATAICRLADKETK